MRTNNWLLKSTNQLKKSGIATARLDVLILLEDMCSKDRGWLLAHPEHQLTKEQLEILDKQVARRTRHEPLAYIRGRCEFYGHTFVVNKHTLEPRPETETMIDLIRKIDLSSSSIIVDVGTGSGCLAISSKILHPEVDVIGIDIDAECIQTARENAKKLGVGVNFMQGNLLKPLSTYEKNELIILANLPYVPDSHTINQAAMFEPKSAIFGGPNGLDLYRQMFDQIDDIDNKPTHVLTESLPFQHKDLSTIAKASGYMQTQEEDFIQIFNRL